MLSSTFKTKKLPHTVKVVYPTINAKQQGLMNYFICTLTKEKLFCVLNCSIWIIDRSTWSVIRDILPWIRIRTFMIHWSAPVCICKNEIGNEDETLPFFFFFRDQNQFLLFFADNKYCKPMFATLEQLHFIDIQYSIF